MEHGNNTVCVISLFIYIAAELQLDVLVTFFSRCRAKTSIHSWLFASTASMKLPSLQGCLLQHGSSRSKLMLMIICVPHPLEQTYSAPSMHISCGHCIHTRDVALNSTCGAWTEVSWKLNLWIHLVNLLGPNWRLSTWMPPWNALLPLSTTPHFAVS